MRALAPAQPGSPGDGGDDVGPGVAPAAKSMIALLTDVARRYTEGPVVTPSTR